MTQTRIGFKFKLSSHSESEQLKLYKWRNSSFKLLRVAAFRRRALVLGPGQPEFQVQSLPGLVSHRSQNKAQLADSDPLQVSIAPGVCQIMVSEVVCTGMYWYIHVLLTFKFIDVLCIWNLAILPDIGVLPDIRSPSDTISGDVSRYWGFLLTRYRAGTCRM